MWSSLGKRIINSIRAASQTMEIKNFILNSKGAGSDGSMCGIHRDNQGSNKLRAGNPMKQLPQPFHQFQHKLVLQDQLNGFELRRLQMGRDGLRWAAGGFSRDGLNSLRNDGQGGFPVLPRPDPEMMLKWFQIPQQQQMQSNDLQQHRYFQQHQLSGQTPQSSNQQISQHDIIIGPESVQGNNDQGSKSQIGKQAVPSSGHANSTGTENTTAPSPSSPSTPSTHNAPGVALPLNNVNSPKSLVQGKGKCCTAHLMLFSEIFSKGQNQNLQLQIPNVPGSSMIPQQQHQMQNNGPQQQQYSQQHQQIRPQYKIFGPGIMVWRSLGRGLQRGGDLHKSWILVKGQQDAKYDQFFRGEYRPLIQDTHGNVLNQNKVLELPLAALELRNKSLCYGK